jgi:hypothetical protein
MTIKSASHLACALAIATAGLGMTTSARADLVTLTGNLDSAQVVDAAGFYTSDSTATGEVSVTMDTVLHTITADLVWRGLTGPSDFSHIHSAPAGVNAQNLDSTFFHEIIWRNPVSVVGGFVDCVPGAVDPTTGELLPPRCAPQTGELHNTLDLTDGSYFDPTGVYGFTDFNALLAALESNGIYVDMHTEMFPDGEIRGQLINQTVPEPSTIALIGLAGVLAAAARRKTV